MITYCHYPLVPFYVKNGIYRRYLHKFIVTDEVKGFNSSNTLIEKLLSNACLLYDSMLRNTIVLTNNDALILKPPVDVKTFRKVALHSHEGQREDIILVVSRFSADKQIENAIKVAKILQEKKVDAKMIIVGNVSRSEWIISNF